MSSEGEIIEQPEANYEYQALVLCNGNKVGYLVQLLVNHGFKFKVGNLEGQYLIEGLPKGDKLNDELSKDYQVRLLQKAKRSLYICLETHLSYLDELNYKKAVSGLNLSAQFALEIQDTKNEIRKDIQAIIKLTGQEPPFLDSINVLLER